MLFCKLKIVQQFPENGNFTQFSIHFLFFCQVLKLKHKHKIKADKNAVTKYSAQKTKTELSTTHSGEKKKTQEETLTLSTTAEKKLIMAVIYDRTLKKTHFNDLAKTNT